MTPIDSFCSFRPAEYVIHAPSNAFFPWLTLPAWLSCNAYLASLLLLTVASFYDFLRSEAFSNSRAASVAGAGLLAVIVTYVYGPDVAALSVLCAMMLLTSVLRRATPEKPGSFLSLAVGSLVATLIAQQAALLSAVFALFLAFPKNFYKERPRLFAAMLLILFVPATYLSLTAPRPELPDYPSEARVVPDYRTDAVGGARFGPEPLGPSINRDYERRAFWLPAVICLALLAPAARRRAGGTSEGRRVLELAVVLNLVLVLDSGLLSAGLAQAMPLQTVRRLFPGGLFLPFINIISLTASASAVAAALIFSRKALSTPTAIVLGISAITFAARANYVSVTPISGEHPLLARSEEEAKLFLLSPSFNVIETAGFWVLRDREEITSLERRPLTEEEVADVVASHGQARVKALFDQNPATRWSSERGGQIGDEWLLIRLHSPLTFRGIELKADKFYTDYPRGLKVEVRQECPAGDTPSTDYRTVFHREPWRGALYFTKKGFPYFGPAHRTRVYFPQEQSAQCILIRQTARSPHFDWSVTEVSLLLSNKAALLNE